MTDEFDPIVNDDGEIIAESEAERLRVLEDAGRVLAEHEALKAAAAHARDVFRLVAREGDGPFVYDGRILDVRMGKRGNRSVDIAEVNERREDLAGTPAAPREDTCTTCGGAGVVEVMPKVADIDGKDARAALVRAGVNPDRLLKPGAPPVVQYGFTEVDG